MTTSIVFLVLLILLTVQLVQTQLAYLALMVNLIRQLGNVSLVVLGHTISVEPVLHVQAAVQLVLVKLPVKLVPLPTTFLEVFAVQLVQIIWYQMVQYVHNVWLSVVYVIKQLHFAQFVMLEFIFIITFAMQLVLLL